ncbi:MAG: DegV family protein [Firmicutes bacterium]|nr:DegV family protein [Bacillota bacterium]
MVKIVTDSSVLYTVEQGKEMNVDIMPLCVSIGDLQGRDTEICLEDFYAHIRKGEHPVSSQPPVGEVMEVFNKYPDEEVICISMADGLSGTYASASAIREQIEHKDNITVINSKTLCGPHRYMLEKAVKMQQEGASAQEIIDYLKWAADHNHSFLIPQDFDFLRRGGRLTPMAATLGSLLKLKPIMTPTPDGRQLEKHGVKRTMKAAINAIVDYYKSVGVCEKHKIYVSHADTLADAEYAVAQLSEAFPGVEIEMLVLHAAFITQGGPYCIAIQYIEK